MGREYDAYGLYFKDLEVAHETNELDEKIYLYHPAKLIPLRLGLRNIWSGQ
jgi:hypothetical protein